MPIQTGSRLGPYEILSPLGAGGMGEVWRARDTRLSREVAIKVLPQELSSDPARLKRFEREAQATSALTHPNIVTIYEVATTDGVSFIAMELVEGKTLRDVMGGSALPLRKLLTIAPQIAEGLAKAHEAGIVHRDLKPENVMVGRDGLVKVLDFGLAKLAYPEQDSGQTNSAMTVSAVTRPGLAMGTAGYMSPEQASGHPVDFRSDQFSFGSMLYEMATGKAAFRRPTTAQTLAAIIDEEPDPIPSVAPGTPAPLRWIAERCMAKEPENRYAATRDLVRDLSNLRDHVSELSTSAGVAIEEPRRRLRWRLLGAIAAILAALAGMLFLGRRLERAGISEPSYRQLTFRGAGIGTARFAPDGQTIVFSSQTEGKPPELLSMRLDGPEVRPLGLPPAHVLSISRSGEMAILLLKPFALYSRIGHGWEQIIARDSRLFEGTLARASLSGGAPRELLENVLFADWAPDGANLAVVHRVGNRNRVESPIGKVVYDGEGEFLNYLRFSPQGDSLAFKDWSLLFIEDRAGKVRNLLREGDDEVVEMAWSGHSQEIWTTSFNPGETLLAGLSSEGRRRLVESLPTDFVLYDVTGDARVLFGRVVQTSEILGSFPDEPRSRNLSHFDRSEAIGLSPSGDRILFIDSSRVGGGGLYSRKADGSPPTLLGSVEGLALSPDGAVVLGVEPAISTERRECCVLMPTGPGQIRRLDSGGIQWFWSEARRSGFFPDGKSVYYVGRATGRRPQVFVQNVDGGRPRAATPEGVRRPVLTSDGRFFCARSSDSEWILYPTDAKGEPRKAVGILPGEEPIQSTPDGRLYVRGADELKQGETLMTTRVYRVDPWTGKRELWKEIPPQDPRTGGGVSTILFSADGKTCVWTHIRYSTELVLAEGLK